MKKPHTLIYWAAQSLVDHSAYNLRAPTLRELKEMLRTRGFDSKGRPLPGQQEPGRPVLWGPAVKQVVRYYDAFDLVQGALGEGGVERF